MSKKISPDNLPFRCPLQATIVLWLLLDRLKAAGWVWGMIGTLLVLMWLSYFVRLFRDEQIDIFTAKKDGGKDA